MTTITIHPKTEEEITLFESLAKHLKTPYEISSDKSDKKKKKPSDFLEQFQWRKERKCMNAYPKAVKNGKGVSDRHELYL